MAGVTEPPPSPAVRGLRPRPTPLLAQDEGVESLGAGRDHADEETEAGDSFRPGFATRRIFAHRQKAPVGQELAPGLRRSPAPPGSAGSQPRSRLLPQRAPRLPARRGPHHAPGEEQPGTKVPKHRGSGGCKRKHGQPLPGQEATLWQETSKLSFEKPHVSSLAAAQCPTG